MVVLRSIMLVACLGLVVESLTAQESERSFAEPYQLHTYSMPDGCVLEVGGLALLPDGRPMACTRRGEVWIINDAFGEDPQAASFHKFAEGLQEPLGLLAHEGWIYTAQRGELSRMRDVDGDDRMDELETVCDGWNISGNYHEYNFGPRLGPDGDLWITTNKPFGSEPFGRVDWRGFALKISLDGSMQPVCCGLRSPAGIGASPWGDLFYTDNQGEWCGASKLSRLVPGSFHGHPWGTFSCERIEWDFAVPKQPTDQIMMPEVSSENPSFELPAVWFPYDKMGRSPSGFVWDETGGRFGPFAGQLFVGDQYAAMIMRVALEEVDGHWQGACFPFQKGLVSGVTRLAWAPDGSLLIGMTDRGWPSLGSEPFGLQRLSWTGSVPFEIANMRATARGFVLEFTKELEREEAERTELYGISSYTYRLHSDYGSDEMDTQELEIQAAFLSQDGRSVELVVKGLREGYVHELHLKDLVSKQGEPLGHSEAYYTLIKRPQ